MPKIKLDIKKLLGYTEKPSGAAIHVLKLGGSKIGSDIKPGGGGASPSS
jgi:hypothetical protein